MRRFHVGLDGREVDRLRYSCSRFGTWNMTLREVLYCERFNIFPHEIQAEEGETRGLLFTMDDRRNGSTVECWRSFCQICKWAVDEDLGFREEDLHKVVRVHFFRCSVDFACEDLVHLGQGLAPLYRSP